MHRLAEGFSKHSGIFVEAVKPGSACDDVGLQTGDEVLEINNLPLPGLTIKQVS